MEAHESPQLGTKAYWVDQAAHVVNFFARVSIDWEDGGYYTHIDYGGNVSNPHEKFLMPTSRQIYGYSTAYMLTGDRRHLDLARHGVDFVLGREPQDGSSLKGHLRYTSEGEVYWVQRLDKSGYLPEDGKDKPVVAINEQTYGLTGLIAYYEAIRDDAAVPETEKDKILDTIQHGHAFITNRLLDTTYGGFHDGYDVATGTPVVTKSYNSIVYPATSVLLDLTRIADGPWRRQTCTQIKQLANLFVEHFPDSSTGFIKENFKEGWTPEWRGWQQQRVRKETDEVPEVARVDENEANNFTASIGVAGHNTQGALFLLRAMKLLQGENMLTPEEASIWYRTAKQLVDNMLERAYDRQHGGWHDVFVRETGQKMWHTNKAWWQQEQGLLATGLLALLEPAEAGQRYRHATLQTLAFWDRAFIDQKLGGDRQRVTREGDPLPEPKGDRGKSSYHSVEMARLAIELGLTRLVETSPSQAKTGDVR
jgi:mannose/cellobiose epimerase-like protein (N-acyl-D-glucosamine 2-epimerase family)